MTVKESGNQELPSDEAKALTTNSEKLTRGKIPLPTGNPSHGDWGGCLTWQELSGTAYGKKSATNIERKRERLPDTFILGSSASVWNFVWLNGLPELSNSYNKPVPRLFSRSAKSLGTSILLWRQTLSPSPPIARVTSGWPVVHLVWRRHKERCWSASSSGFLLTGRFRVRYSRRTVWSVELPGINVEIIQDYGTALSSGFLGLWHHKHSLIEILIKVPGKNNPVLTFFSKKSSPFPRKLSPSPFQSRSCSFARVATADSFIRRTSSWLTPV